MATTAARTTRDALVRELWDSRMRILDIFNDAWENVTVMMNAVDDGDVARLAAALHRSDLTRAKLALALDELGRTCDKLTRLLASRANPAVSGLTNVPPPASATSPTTTAKPPAPFGGRFIPNPKP